MSTSSRSDGARNSDLVGPSQFHCTTFPILVRFGRGRSRVWWQRVNMRPLWNPCICCSPLSRRVALVQWVLAPGRSYMRHTARFLTSAQTSSCPSRLSLASFLPLFRTSESLPSGNYSRLISLFFFHRAVTTLPLDRSLLIQASQVGRDRHVTTTLPFNNNTNNNNCVVLFPSYIYLTFVPRS